MDDKTTTVVVVGVVLVAAVYLATRHQTPLTTIDDDDDGPSVCGAVGKLDGRAGAACSVATPVIGAIKSAFTSHATGCQSAQPGRRYWEVEYGDKGRQIADRVYGKCADHRKKK